MFLKLENQIINIDTISKIIKNKDEHSNSEYFIIEFVGNIQNLYVIKHVSAVDFFIIDCFYKNCKTYNYCNCENSL